MIGFEGAFGDEIGVDARAFLDGARKPDAFAICGDLGFLGTYEGAALAMRNGYAAVLCGQAYASNEVGSPLSIDEVALVALRGGAAAVENLLGQFAVTVWSERERHLLLYRDASGALPLYYRQDGGKLFVSCREDVAKGFWPVPVGEVLILRSTGRPRPFQIGDPSLRGSFLIDVNGRARPMQKTARQPIRAVVLDDRVKTKVLAARLFELSPDQPLHSFAIGSGWDDPRILAARGFAEAIGTVHHEIVVEANALKDLLRATVDIVGKPGLHVRSGLFYALLREAAEVVQELFVAQGDGECRPGEQQAQALLARALKLKVHFVDAGMTAGQPEPAGLRFREMFASYPTSTAPKTTLQ